MEIDKFSAHGEVHAHFQAEQNILHIDLVGPFNLEFMQKYEREVDAQRLAHKERILIHRVGEA